MYPLHFFHCLSLGLSRPSVAMSPCLPLSHAPSFCLLRWAGSGTGLLGPQVVEEGQAAPCGVSGSLLGQGSSLRAGTERRKRVPESAVSSHPSQCVRSCPRGSCLSWGPPPALRQPPP